MTPAGSFGMFVSTLICAGSRPASRARRIGRIAGLLLGFMDDDPFSFCFGIEKEMGSALSAAGLAAP